jgi:transcriptional regulator
MALYLPPHFEQTDADAVREVVEAFPFATLITTGTDGIVANHIPLQWAPDESEHGVLRGHVARNNDVWRLTDPDIEVLAVFQAPDSYVTPNWYRSKEETHRVVPTWNYAVVHAYGGIRFIDDPKWLRGVLGRLTRDMEAGEATPWRMAQAPADYLETQLDSIVGVEIEISRILAKWKMSQNRTDADREGVALGLRARGDAAAAWVADSVEPRRNP